MDQRLVDWMEHSEKVLGMAAPEERTPAVAALFAQVVMDLSVQGQAVVAADRKACRSALAQHLIRATAQFFDLRDLRERTK